MVNWYLIIAKRMARHYFAVKRRLPFFYDFRAFFCQFWQDYFTKIFYFVIPKPDLVKWAKRIGLPETNYLISAALYVCKLCEDNDGFYVGQTTNTCRTIANGHRSDFNFRDYSKSALAYHIWWTSWLHNGETEQLQAWYCESQQPYGIRPLWGLFCWTD